MCYSRINSTNFAIKGGGKLTNSLMEKIGKQTLIARAFMEKLTQIHQIPKISNSPFFNDKFQWVIEYIEFFLANFHIGI
jgi:hypothetical protein